jgi:hypothetical protein
VLRITIRYTMCCDSDGGNVGCKKPRHPVLLTRKSSSTAWYPKVVNASTVCTQTFVLVLYELLRHVHDYLRRYITMTAWYHYR